MPITSSAKKHLRQDVKRRKRNIRYKTRVKEVEKQIKRLIAENKKKEARELLPLFYKRVDKATKVGVIKKNTASRMKSRQSKALKT